MQKPRRPAAQRNRRTTRTSPATTANARDQAASRGSSSRDADASHIRKRGGLLMAAGLASGAAALLYSWIGRGRRKSADADAQAGGSGSGANEVSPAKSSARKLRPAGANISSAISTVSKGVTAFRSDKRANVGKGKPDAITAAGRPAPGENTLPLSRPSSRTRKGAAETAPSTIASRPDGSPRKRGRPRKNAIESEISMGTTGRNPRGASGSDARSESGALITTEIENSPSPLISDAVATRSTGDGKEPTILLSATPHVEDTSSSSPAESAKVSGRKRGRPAKTAPAQTRDPVDVD